MANGNGSGLWKAIAGACFTCAVGAVGWNFTQIESIKQRQSDIMAQLAKFQAIQEMGWERVRKIEELERQHQKEERQ